MRLRKKPWIEEAMKELIGTYVYMDGIENFRGHWQELFPGKELCLEIGTGKGRFITGMALKYPDKAFIGVEVQHDIAYYPAVRAREAGLKNVLIICRRAEKLSEWFAPGEIKSLYLNFSDPWPKKRHAKRRLTHRNFLAEYKEILGEGAHLYFKTDNRPLFDFSLEEFRAFGLGIAALTYDLHNSGFPEQVRTEYEEKWSAKGTPINFCEAVF